MPGPGHRQAQGGIFPTQDAKSLQQGLQTLEGREGAEEEQLRRGRLGQAQRRVIGSGGDMQVTRAGPARRQPFHVTLHGQADHVGAGSQPGQQAGAMQRKSPSGGFEGAQVGQLGQLVQRNHGGQADGMRPGHAQKT